MDYTYEYHKIASQLAILKDVATIYPTSSIPNAIRQLESRLEFVKSNLNK